MLHQRSSIPIYIYTWKYLVMDLVGLWLSSLVEIPFFGGRRGTVLVGLNTPTNELIDLAKFSRSILTTTV